MNDRKKLTRKEVEILIVEDSPTQAEQLKYTLQKEGYSVSVASDGEQGVKLAKEKKPDLVLMDIMMPGLNGFEVLRIIRQRFNIPVIMLTAVQEVTSVRDAIDLGADDYVRKPFHKGELLARIEAKLRRAKK